MTGLLSQVENAFNVTINDYTLLGEKLFSNDSEPSVPADVAAVIRAIVGLTSLGGGGLPSTGAAPQSDAVTYTPADIATYYDLPNANNRQGQPPFYDGQGVNVAIGTFFNYQQTDLDTYWQFFHIVRTGSVEYLPVNGTSSEISRETTADIEQVGANAPGANLLVYAAQELRPTNFSLMLNRIVDENRADIATVSWGYCEGVLPPATMQADHAILRQADVQGISLFISPGDSGAYGCYPLSTQPAVWYPAGDPNVTAVGGTTLRFNADGTRNETAWDFSPGADSSIFPRPDWQQGPGVPASGMRSVSDVSFDADFDTGYWMYWNGGWYHQQGGTSLATPNWAALWALAVQAQNGARTGNAAPWIYAIGNSQTYQSVFHDITIGSNGAGIGPGFSAGPGWDYPTGWGTPDGTQLVQTMQLIFNNPQP